MWPFTTSTHGLWLVLYVLTWALHAVFVSYVLVGSAYALVQALRGANADPVAERVRDRLPFMLGCGITAGVAPLLFLQLLYQERFYTANLLLGPRWGAVVPALIVGFYALYLAKATPSALRRKLALGTAVACFLFVAWSWTELHLVMRDQAAWREMYAAGDRLYGQRAVLPRLLLWLGAMTTLFALVAIWWASGAERRRLAIIGFLGHVPIALAVVLFVAGGGELAAGARAWMYLLVAAVAIELAGWAWMMKHPDGRAVPIVTTAGTAALLAGAVVREAPRLVLLEPPRPAALEAAGMPVFLATLVFGVLAITWVARIVRTRTPE